MSKMSVKEALAKVLKDMRAMSADELRAQLDAHRNGAIATALRDAEQFLNDHYFFHAHLVSPISALLHGDQTVSTWERSLESLEFLLAANDNSYALAA